MRLAKGMSVTVAMCLWVLSTVWLFPSNASGKPVELRAVAAWPVNHTVVALYHKFLDALNKRSGGQLKVRLVGGPEVVSVRDGLKATGQGTIDILYGDPHYYGGELPLTQIFGYIHPKRGAAVEALDQPGAREWVQEVTRKVANVVFLGLHYEQPFYIQTVKKPAISPADFKGLKLRSPGGLYAEVLGATGAVPTRIASTETYEALQRGVVDGTMRNTASLRYFKEYEIIRYIMMPAILAPRTIIVMNANSWDKLSPQMRKVITDTSLEFDRRDIEYWWNQDTEDMKWMLDQGVVETVEMSVEAAQIMAKARVRAIDKLKEQLGPELGEKLEKFFGPYVR